MNPRAVDQHLRGLYLILELALRTKEKAFGADHINTADTINNLGSTYDSQGKYLRRGDRTVRTGVEDQREGVRSGSSIRRMSIHSPTTKFTDSSSTTTYLLLKYPLSLASIPNFFTQNPTPKCIHLERRPLLKCIHSQNAPPPNYIYSTVPPNCTPPKPCK